MTKPYVFSRKNDFFSGLAFYKQGVLGIDRPKRLLSALVPIPLSFMDSRYVNKESTLKSILVNKTSSIGIKDTGTDEISYKAKFILSLLTT